MKRIYVWGTGVGATRIFNEQLGTNDITGFVQSDPRNREFLGKTVITPEELTKSQYDLIIVASNSSHEIRKTCMKYNLDLDKVYFVYRHYEELRDLNKTSEITVRNVLEGDEWLNATRSDAIVIPKNSNQLTVPTMQLVEMSWLKERDYVRVQTLENIVSIIRRHRIEGSLAELGVFKGEFSQLLNALLPERKIYLFDSFTSFKTEEFEVEKAKRNCNDEFRFGFLDTNEDTVLSIMPSKENAVIIKGYFPESMNGHQELENETYALVSLDVDFKNAIYDGLEYFYPRLNRNGYILVHDYLSDLSGVASAVDEYEKHHSCVLRKVPLCDEFGTLVITK